MIENKSILNDLKKMTLNRIGSGTALPY